MNRVLSIARSPAVIAGMAVLCGVVMDALIKAISAEVDLVSIVFWRFSLAAILVAVPFFVSGRRLPGWQITRLHVLRSLLHMCAAFLFFFALGKLKLAEVTTLGFTAALLVLPVAWLVLGERIHPVSGGAGLLGFAGVLVTLSGGDVSFELSHDRLVGVGAVLLSTCCYSFSLVLLRMRAAIDGGFLVALYANLFPALFMAPVALVFGKPTSWSYAPIFLGIAVLGLTIWLLMTWAYARAPAQRLAPLEFTALLWSGIIGWLFFREVPGISLWIGAVLIVAACGIVVWQDNRAQKSEAVDPG